MFLPLKPEVRYFLMLAQTRNISRAAEILGVQQPALSKSLKRLEGEWGAPLFSRSKKGIELTLEGERARKILSGLQGSWDSSNKVGDDGAALGTLKMGAHISTVQTSFRKFFPELLSRFPGLNMDLTYDRSLTITRKVIHAELDLGIAINPQRHPELVIKTLRREFIGVWKGSRAQTAKPKNVYFNPDMINVFQFLRQFSGSRQIPITDYVAIGSILSTGEDWGIMPSSIPEIFPSLVPVKTLMPAQLCLIYRKDRSHHTMMQRVAAVVRAGFQS